MKHDVLAFSLALTGVFLAGCATISTRVVPLDPVLRLASGEHVVIPLERPQRPHRPIALIELRGTVNGSEIELLENAREKARAPGADAIVRLEIEMTTRTPVVVYDPQFAPFYYGYPFRAYLHFDAPLPGAYRVSGRDTFYRHRVLAINFAEKSGD